MSVNSSIRRKRKPYTPGILWRCYRYLRPYWKIALGIYIAMLAINLFTILTPQFIRWIIDRGIYGNDIGLLNLAVLGLLGMTAVKDLITYLQGTWTEVASQHVACDMRNEIQRKLDRLSFSFHDQRKSGQILSRSTQDVERIRFLTGRAVLRMVVGFVLLVGTGGVLIWMNPSLGMLGVLTTHVEQNLRGAMVVKGFSQEEA